MNKYIKIILLILFFISSIKVSHSQEVIKSEDMVEWDESKVEKTEEISDKKVKKQDILIKKNIYKGFFIGGKVGFSGYSFHKLDQKYNYDKNLEESINISAGINIGYNWQIDNNYIFGIEGGLGYLGKTIDKGNFEEIISFYTDFQFGKSFNLIYPHMLIGLQSTFYDLDITTIDIRYGLGVSYKVSKRVILNTDFILTNNIAGYKNSDYIDSNFYNINYSLLIGIKLIFGSF